ncbi:MAG: alpha/beta hydrolase-fold protein, partial [Planctomycetota bacterium]|nr:alpha/beta hydrolase-fold protein [Planctomycetota bacterium]
DHDPLDAPFFRRPQPIRSIPVDPGRLLADGGQTAWNLSDDVDGVAAVPNRIDDLEGRFNVRAVLDLGHDRDHAATGNGVSAISEFTLTPGISDRMELVIDRVLPEPARPDRENLVWIEIESPLLTARLGRPVRHRAGVALPPSYHDVDAERRFFPTVYVSPGFGGDETDAVGWAELLENRSLEASMPEAVFVVLDPEDPLGHHGFVDGANVGPRATGLVREFMPWLEKRFRLVADPEARFLLGHSSGAWSSVWLQLEHPEVFGGCFASAPDPVDFTAFGAVDLRADDSLHVDDQGESRPSYRSPLTKDLDRIHMTVQEETRMEHAIDPEGTSGEQWSAWNAMFSGLDRTTGRPRAAFDLKSGCIDREVILQDWTRFDITARLREDPADVGPILNDRVRILCGDRDCFYLDEAVRRLRRELEIVREEFDLGDGAGSIEILEGATHDSIVGPAMRRWLPELRTLAERAPTR